MSDRIETIDGSTNKTGKSILRNKNLDSQRNNTSSILFQKIGLSPVPYVILGLLLAVATGFSVNFTSTYPPLLIIGVAIGLILVVSVFQKPELGGYILLFSVFTNLSDLFTEKGLPSINKPLVAIVVLSVFANYILRTGKIRALPKITKIEFLLVVYLLSVLSSSFFAINQSKALTALFDLLKDVTVGYCIYLTLNTKEKVETGLNILIAAVTFVSILGVIHTITGTSSDFWGFAQDSAFGQISDSDGQLRYAGPLGESNIWGQVLVSCIPIIFYKIVYAQDLLKKAIPAMSGLLIVLAMLFTESRGAFLALVFIVILIAIDLRIRSTTLITLTLIGLLMLAILPKKYSERILSLDVFFQNQEYGLTQDESFNGRQAKMLIGLAMFADNPFLGVGFANYTENYWDYAGNLGIDSSVLAVGTEAEGEEQQPHSLYVEIMAETGIFGIASFVGFLGSIFLGLQQTRRKAIASKTKVDKYWFMMTSAIMMSIITFLVAGFFLHGIGFRFIWALIGTSLAFVYQGQNQNKYIAPA